MQPPGLSSSFLNTIHEDQSDGTGSVNNATAATATATATSPNSASFKNLLSHRVGKTGAPSVCNSSVNSSTGGIDSVEGKLSVVSDMQAVVLGGADTEEYEGTSPASLLADAGHTRAEQHRADGKVRTLCFCFVLTRRNLYLGVSALVLTLGVLSAIIAVVVTNRGNDQGGARVDAVTQESEFRNYIKSLLNETTQDATVWDSKESASYKAVDWIVYNDTLRDEILKEGIPRLRQRFALAHLYFSTGGPTFWSLNQTITEESKTIDFLNPLTSECNWTGVTCDTLELELLSSDESTTNSSLDEEKNHVFRLLFRGMNLSGSIPTELGTCIPSLRELDFSFNALQGTIPAVLFEGGWFSSLYWLDLSENQLTGSIPPAVWSLRVLEFLFLHRNKLSGQIVRVEERSGGGGDNGTTPKETNVTGIRQGNFLKQVALYRNSLTGSLPTWLTELKDLREWVAYENQISGPLLDPPESLEWFDMSYNMLTGPIPETMWSLPTSPPLEKLYLDHNQLSGVLPNATRRRQNMHTLWLHNNLLTGTIPEGFAQEWKQLKDLRIQGNAGLTGTLGPLNATEAECEMIWPMEEKFIIACPEELVNTEVLPPVLCACCNTTCE